jgi:hypothetical protein
MLNLSALFISQKRLSEVLTPDALPYAATHFSFADRKSDGMLRRQVLTAYEDAAIDWLSSAQLPTLGELLMGGKASQGDFFTHIGPFFGRNTQEADMRYEEGKLIKKEAILWTKLDGFGEGRTLTVQAHPENYTTRSASGEMAGKKRLFMVGRLTDCDSNEMRAQAYVVGHLHEEPRPSKPAIDRFNLLPQQMEVFPPMVDNFSKAQGEGMPTAAELKWGTAQIPPSRVVATQGFDPDWGDDGALGYDVLLRFRVFLDMPSRWAYLRPLEAAAEGGR